MTSMRAATKMVILSLLIFAAAFAARRTFFSDVMPVSWDQEPSSAGALVMAYLLLSIENITAVVAAIALVVELVLGITRLATRRFRTADL